MVENDKNEMVIKDEDKEIDKFITIGEDDYYRIVLLDKNEFDTSMFRDCFKNAVSNLIEIVDSATRGDHIRQNKRIFEEMSDMNNIISFVGDRGTGKTSTMLSFARALEELDIPHNEKNRLGYEMTFKEWGNRSQNIKFKVMDVIDPMMIGENESILQIVIAKLFSDFKESIKNDEDTCYSENREILECFSNIFSNLKILYSSDIMKSVDTYDSLEALNSLAVGVNMKNKIKYLVDLLLKKYKHKDYKSFLVIPIDDLDLSISKVENMIEEIRKYLMIPNIIILLSANMDQLSDSIEQMFIREYKELLSIKRELHEPTKLMASRYLEKLFPLNRRIFMPNL